MFHVERMVVCCAAVLLVLVLVLGPWCLRAAFWVQCWACVGAGKGRLVRVLMAWSSSSGGALLGLGATLLDVIDAAQHAARRTRYSCPLVSPRGVDGSASVG